ncbi:MAG: hypothetical protein Q9197_004185 [Variospora fuerteventurae]
MSTPAPAAPGAPEEEPKGLSKFVRRASKVFRRRSSARGSISSPTDLTQTPSGAGAVTAASTEAPMSRHVQEAEALTTFEEQATTAPAAPAPAPAPAATEQTTGQKVAKPTTAKTVMTTATYSTIQEEKARALFEKYGLTLEPGEWTKPIKPDAERVEKKIRMRVHRICHHCQATFGPDKVCSNCKHSRCKSCPRLPIKRTKEQKAKAIAAAGGGIATTGTAAAAIGDTTLSLKSLTISSRATGKQVTYKPVTQRLLSAPNAGTIAVHSAREIRLNRTNTPRGILATPA